MFHNLGKPLKPNGLLAQTATKSDSRPNRKRFSAGLMIVDGGNTELINPSNGLMMTIENLVENRSDSVLTMRWAGC